jgi:hypothetical protein
MKIAKHSANEISVTAWAIDPVAYLPHIKEFRAIGIYKWPPSGAKLPKGTEGCTIALFETRKEAQDECRNFRGCRPVRVTVTIRRAARPK